MKISNIRKEENAVFFTIEKEYNGTMESLNYRTNENGEGLFRDSDFWYSKQLAGTCDFKLKQKTISGIRKAIERQFAE